MIAHHLLKEETAIQQCMYCGKMLDLKGWKSKFYIWKHYKTIKCECGKSHQVTIKHFQSSGHDSWLDQIVKELNLNTLEDKV